MNSSIRTYTGRDFYPLSPNQSDIDIKDIAHALSLKCRFGGHCREFYSVAEHSCRVSYYILNKIPGDYYSAFWGLMHDSAEAYLADVPSPVKKELKEFCGVEDNLLFIIMDKYGLDYPPPPIVKEADIVLLVTEARDLLPSVWDGFDGSSALKDTIKPWPMSLSETKFLELFDKYSSLL